MGLRLPRTPAIYSGETSSASYLLGRLSLNSARQEQDAKETMAFVSEVVVAHEGADGQFVARVGPCHLRVDALTLTLQAAGGRTLFHHGVASLCLGLSSRKLLICPKDRSACWLAQLPEESVTARLLAHLQTACDSADVTVVSCGPAGLAKPSMQEELEMASSPGERARLDPGTPQPPRPCRFACM